MTAPDLLPCPSCGSGKATTRQNASFSGVEVLQCQGRFFVNCGTCGCRGSSEETETEAIAAWNTRATPAPAAMTPEVPTAAARDVLAERARQVSAEGWTPEHDDTHFEGAIARGAASYALSSAGYRSLAVEVWPWSDDWWKPTTPRADLVKAGALILAEIERIDRAALRAGGDA